MPIERSQTTNKPAPFTQEGAKDGSVVNSGPYIAVVKNNVDPQRMGRLQVYVSLLSPQEEDNTKWVTVNYAPPYYGHYTTDIDSKEDKNGYYTTRQSYGMWMVPPDIGIKVLVIFAEGDITKGFWIACIMDAHNHYMVPSMGASINSDWITDNKEIPSDRRPDRVPVVEFNDRNKDLGSQPNWEKNNKPLHQEQLLQLRKQGLDFDYVRGPILSSSQRESPSQVFGISTPGRLINRKDVANKKIRKGGHTFVMDDGDTTGANNFLRLKTGGGHQILMHDTSDFIYISNSKGTAWVELDASGNIDIFSEGTFSLRAADSINLHADKDINMYAGNRLTVVAEQGTDLQSLYVNINSTKNTTIHACGTLNFKSGAITNLDGGTAINVKASGALSLRGEKVNLNCGGTAAVPPLADIPRSSYPNALLTADSYRSSPKRISSVATRVPTHEPDINHNVISEQIRNPNAIAMTDAEAKKQGTEGVVPPPPAKNCVTSTGTPVIEGVPNSATPPPLVDNNKAVAAVPKDAGTLANNLGKQPDPVVAIGTLTKDETKAYMVGMAAPDMKYDAVTLGGFVGKYQMGAGALVGQGLVSKDLYSLYGGLSSGNQVLNDPGAWTGMNGITSKALFLQAPGVQELTMQSFTESNFRSCVGNGAIKPGDGAADVAGVLASAHHLGAAGAYITRYGQATADSIGMSGLALVAKGKFAINTLTNNGSLMA